MGNTIDSQFTNSTTWVTLNKTGSKQIIQNKHTQMVIEKHFYHFHDSETYKQQNAIYEWRAQPKNNQHFVQILEKKVEDEHVETKGCTYDLCKSQETNIKLTVYTERINKLYEYNSKIDLTELQQFKILKSIIEGVELLNQRFGYFMISKQMMGYNSNKIGKVWMNQNFAFNYAQYKKNLKKKEEKEKYEADVIEIMIDTCLLCTTDGGVGKNSKFYEAITRLRVKKAASFADILQLYNEKLRQLQNSKWQSKNKLISTQRIIKGNLCSKMDQNRDLIVSNRLIGSAGTNKKINNQNSQRFSIAPLVTVNRMTSASEPNRSVADSSVGNSLATLKNSSVKQEGNYVQLNQSTHSFMDKVHQLSKKKRVGRTSKRKDLQKISQEDSSKVCERDEKIKLVDSMFVVEELDPNDFHDSPSKIILEESVILRGNVSHRELS